MNVTVGPAHKIIPMPDILPPAKQTPHGMRRFVVKHRDRGPTVVAEGIKFSDGTLAVRWKDDGFTQPYKSIPELLSRWEHSSIHWVDL